MRNHSLYLKDILTAITSIEEFVKGMDQDPTNKTSYLRN